MTAAPTYLRGARPLVSYLELAGLPSAVRWRSAKPGSAPRRSPATAPKVTHRTRPTTECLATCVVQREPYAWVEQTRG